MEVAFPEVGFSPKVRDEIDDVFHRISVDEESGSRESGEWRSWPDKIEIPGRLSGGRSGSEVLEVIVKRGNHEAHRVIKLGWGHDLENEFKAFDTYLRDASALFVPIEAATPVALGRERPRRGEREAVIYDHAARFQGMPQNKMRTFEEIAHEAIQHGGPMLEKAVKILETLFNGIHNDLYDKRQVYDQETSLQKSWNRRLGIDAVVAIDRIDSANKALETSFHPPYGGEQKILRPRGIASASIRVDVEAAKGDIVQVNRARMTWQGDQLVAEEDAHSLRIEVVADPNLVYQLASMIENGSRWMLRGELVSLRMKTHRERLLNGLGGDFKLADGVLTGPEARVPDPFAALPGVMENSRSHRITSVIHGDLNPRNILVIDENPCMIDYALTRDDEPILMDFTRLEGCLTRDVLPAELTWAQHVRLQRLLAAACRLGDEAARHFEERLAVDSAKFASAFRLLWTIRRAAYDLYPRDYQSQWVRDYLEQLFLFANLTLKWDGKEELVPQKLCATAAMAGVAAEALTNTDIYDLWSTEALREDGGEIIQVVQTRPEAFLSELANLARVWHRLVSKQDSTLQDAFENARVGFVKYRFRDAANDAINRLNADHEMYISLKAYIDLKGELRGGYQRQWRLQRAMLIDNELPSFKKMLATDELFAESELLRTPLGTREDVLSLITENPIVMLIGDAGSGKSTVAREWEYRLASAIVGQVRTFSGFDGSNPTIKTSLVKHTIQNLSSEAQNSTLPTIKPRMPIILRAPDLPEHLQNWDEHNLGSTVSILGRNERDIDLLTIGALYIIVDALNELTEEQKKIVASWIIALRNAFSGTPILVCHRLYNYVPGLLPFPVITLQKVEPEQARRYIYDYLREKDVPNYEQLAQRLVSLLLDDPDYAQVRDLAQTPLFLWMIVEHYRETGKVPQSRGGLFETFSRWYLEQRYHQAHHEMTRTLYTYEEKALLLGALGYEMVQRRETSLPEKDVQRLVPKKIKDHWQAVLEEIIAAEMLYRDGKNLRFLHQSFQEYFAARHFLNTQAKNSAAMRRKVSQFGWHETFSMMLGFAGEAPEVVTQVIEEALKIDPLLTARCLRMAERPDPGLLERFVASQEAILENAQAGEYAQERAAQALTEFGRDQARTALWRIIDAADAPEPARIASLKSVAAMPAQVRFEPVVEQIRQELVNHLPLIFDGVAPIAVKRAAIDAIVTVRLKDLSMYLANLIEDEEWPLCRAAWQACGQLRLKLTPRQQSAFVTNCRKQLDKLEEELYQEMVIDRIDELNLERLYILRQLDMPNNLSLLLKRRFSFGIGNEVEAIIDQVVQMNGELPVESQDAWRVLTLEPIREAEEIDTVIDHWLEQLRGRDDLVALAAAHRLIRFVKKIPIEKLLLFFDPDLPPERLSAVAGLVLAFSDESLSRPLEALISSLLETVTDSKEFEAFTNLVYTLKALDSHMGTRFIATADTLFVQQDMGLYFPWRMLIYRNYPQTEDYQLLLTTGGNDARTAILELNARGGFHSQEAASIPHTELDVVAVRQLQNLAWGEQDPIWQQKFAGAIMMVQALDLLPWLIDIAHIPETAKKWETSYDTIYGAHKESCLARILRAIGYLTRVILDKKQTDEVSIALTFLHERYAGLQFDEERSIVVGLTTGLGYLGNWEPILTHLGPGEPWMHKAAENVLELWVPTPLNAKSAKKQREEAAIWITHRLRDHPDLVPQARSTLERIKNALERQLGRHIQVDDV